MVLEEWRNRRVYSLLLLVFAAWSVCAETPIQGRFAVRDRAAGGFWDSDFRRAGIALEVKTESLAGAVGYDVAVRDLMGRDRAVSIKYAIHVPPGKVTWFAHFRRMVTPEEGAKRELGEYYHEGDVGGKFHSKLPIAALAVDGVPYAIGVDNTLPGFYRIGYLPATREFKIEYDFGLATPEKNEAHVRFLVFDFKAEDGLRGALARYRTFFPWAFESRVKKHGALLSFINASAIPNAADFGFRFKEADYEPEKDDAADILTFHYAEPCTWWMPIDEMKGEESVVGGVERQAQLMALGCKLAAAHVATNNPRAIAWRNCCFEGPDGKPIGTVERTAWCNGILWNINSAPGIVGSFTDWKLKIDNADFEARYARPFPQGVDGEFLDSTEMFKTAPLDFCRAHFAAMKTPLVFDAKTFRPAIYKGMIAHEYCRAVSEKVRAKGRFAMANGTPNRWSWNAPFIDVFCWECGWLDKKNGWAWKPTDDDKLLVFRAFIGDKPFSLEMNTDYDRLTHEMVEKFMQHCLLYGFAPTFFSAASSGAKNKTRYFRRPDRYERDRDLFKKYQPFVRLVSEAGWRPVNRLLPLDDQGVYSEQYGARYVVVFNPSTSESRTVKVRPAAELVTGVRVEGTLTIPPESSRLLDFGE